MSELKSRRLFLSAAGVSIALPFLPSALWSRRASAAGAATPPRRFLSWFVPNGMVMYDFTPSTVGTGWTPPAILAPLAPVQKKIAILTGLDHEQIALPQPSPTGSPPGGHGSGTGCFLSMMSVDGHATDATRTSLDQMLLPVLNAGSAPRMTSMQIGLQGDNGLCDRADCNFSRAISWKNGAALPNQYDPSLLFDSMFSGATTTTPTPTTTAASMARAAEQKSILDTVIGQATTLSAKLNTADKARLDQYLTSVRDVETSLQAQATAKPLMCKIPTKPASPGVLNFNRGITPGTILQMDMPVFIQLMGLAFTCDITRSITFMVGNGTSNNDYGFLPACGGSAPHHGTSHHMGAASALAKLTAIDTWEITQLASLLTTLDATPDVDGTSTILDNTTFYLSSDIGDGNSHNHWDMPVILGGTASGKLKTGGQHINYTDGTAGRGPALTLPRKGTATQLVGPRNPNQNTGQVHLSILAAHGLPSTKIGVLTSTPLTEILV